LYREAERCREQAAVSKPDEQRLLHKIADVFERIASEAEAREQVDRTRCW